MNPQTREHGDRTVRDCATRIAQFDWRDGCWHIPDDTLRLLILRAMETVEGGQKSGRAGSPALEKG